MIWEDWGLEKLGGGGIAISWTAPCSRPSFEARNKFGFYSFVGQYSFGKDGDGVAWLSLPISAFSSVHRTLERVSKPLNLCPKKLNKKLKRILPHLKKVLFISWINVWSSDGWLVQLPSREGLLCPVLLLFLEDKYCNAAFLRGTNTAMPNFS